MWYLLELEWKKWNKQLVFRILLGGYLLLLPSLLLVGKKLPDLPPPIGTTDVLFIFPTVWEYLGYVGNWLSFFFLGFLAVVLITTEHSNKTFRQNIIDGLKRRDFVLAKICFVGLIALLATAYYVLCALIIGAFNTDIVIVQKVFQNWMYIPRYFLMVSGYMYFGLFIGFLLKRTGLSLFLYLSYIMMLEPLLRWGVHQNISRHRSMHFYPMNAVEDLLPVPYTDVADEFLQKFGFSLFLQPWEAIIAVLGYTALFLFLVFRIVRKSDL